MKTKNFKIRVAMVFEKTVKAPNKTDAKKEALRKMDAIKPSNMIDTRWSFSKRKLVKDIDVCEELS